MVRVLATLAVVSLILVGLLVQHAAMIPRRVVAPELPAPVPRGVPLVRIEPSATPITTAAEAQAVLDWWSQQPAALLEEVAHALSSYALAERPVTHLAYVATDGARVVLQTDALGLLSTCRFDANGLLLSFTRNEDDRLPIVLPYEPAPQSSLTPTELTSLAGCLARLGTSIPSVYVDESGLPSEGGTWEQAGEEWVNTIRVEGAGGGWRKTVRLSRHGAHRGSGVYIVRRCGCGMPRTAPPSEQADPEPPAPLANN